MRGRSGKLLGVVRTGSQIPIILKMIGVGKGLKAIPKDQSLTVAVRFNPFPSKVLYTGPRVVYRNDAAPQPAADRPRALGYMVWMRMIDT